MRILMFILFLTCSLLAAGQSTPAANGGAPTLADLARKNRKAKSAKVITSEDMKAADPNTMPLASAPAGAGGGPAEASTDSAKGVGNASGPKTAQGKEALAAAQAKAEKLKQEEDGLSMDVNKLETSIAEGGEFRRASLSDVLEKNKSQLADVQKQRQEADQQVEKLKAPAKKAPVKK